MSSAVLIGWIATVITIAYTSMGLPTQIRAVLKQKSTHGLSLFMTVMLFLTFTSWSFYGAAKSDIFLLIPNMIGSLCAGVLLLLFWKFRGK